MPGRPVSTPPSVRETAVTFLAPVLNHMQITICRARRYRPPSIRETVVNFLASVSNHMEITICQACQYRHLHHPRSCRHLIGFCLEPCAKSNMPSRLVSTPPRSAKLSSLFSLVFCIFLPRCILRRKLYKKRAPRGINNDFA